MLTKAFDTATAGIQATQYAIGIVSQNIANAGVGGFVKRSVTTVSGPGNSGVAVSSVGRVFEESALTRLRLETSKAGYASTKSDLLSQIDRLHGKPGESTTLDGRLNALTQACQGLASNPASAAVRRSVVNAACALTDQIRGIAGSLDALNKDVGERLGTDVSAASGLLASIAGLNVKVASTADSGARAELLDQRDKQITQLASYLDVTATTLPDGSKSLMTTSGVLLVDRGVAASLAVDRRALDDVSGPGSARLATPVTATLPGGGTIGLGRSDFRLGSVAAALDLLAAALPRAQRRLDDLAFALAQSLTDKRVTATPSGTGFELSAKDLADIKLGNTITLSINSTGAPRSVILVASAQAPREVNPILTVDANARAQTFKIPASPATVQDFADAISAALGAVAPGLAATRTSAGTVALSGTGVQGAVATITQPTSAGDFSGGRLQFPLFVDGNVGTLITGSLDEGAQRLGLAERLTVNPRLIDNPAPLGARADGTPDPARATFVVDALTKDPQTFSSASGIGGTSAAGEATVVSFAQDVISVAGDAAATSKARDEQQRVALTVAQGAFSRSAGVSLDEEMSRLITLQTAYAANARVLTAAREMLDALLRS